MKPQRNQLLQSPSQRLIYVPNDPHLWLSVMQQHHDHFLRGHPGIRKTKALIMRTYYWPGMKQDIRQYNLSCFECNRTKIHRRKLLGTLRPLPISWSFDLPIFSTFDAIMVVVCQLTKQAVFISCNKTNNTVQLAKLFIHHVFSKHGLPIHIISD